MPTTRKTKPAPTAKHKSAAPVASKRAAAPSKPAVAKRVASPAKPAAPARAATAAHAKPVAVLHRLETRLHRPAKRKFRRDERNSFFIRKAHKIAKQPARNDQLISELPTER